MTTPYILLSAGGETRPALVLGQGLPTSVGGQPVSYAWKDMVRVGQYRHPKSGQAIDITPERIGKWIGNFDAMSRAGVKVNVPLDHSRQAKDNRGYVLQVRRNGDWLQGLHQFIGEDAARDGARNEVSIWAEENYKDGHGNVYDEAIIHSSLVPDPVIPGQSLAIAASRGYAADSPIFLPADLEIPMTPAQLAEVKELLGESGKDLTAETALPALLAHAKTGKLALSTSATALTTEQAKAVTLSTQLAEANVAKAAAETKALALSASAGGYKAPDASMLEEIAEVDDDGLDRLVREGRITPAVRDKLSTALLGKAGSRNALALSRDANGGQSRLSKLIIAALDENKPVKPGEKSGTQILSRSNPADDGVTVGDIAATVAEMVRTVNPGYKPATKAA